MIGPDYKVGDSVRISNPILPTENYLIGVVSIIERVFYPDGYYLTDIHHTRDIDDDEDYAHQIFWIECELEPVCINGVYV